MLLWADTFNNYFHPHIAQAVVEVLEDAGMQVVVPRRSLCCGRPLYDYGMLKTAKKLLEETLEALQPEIAAGTPLVGIEPSCLAVFRDELHGLFPHDTAAKRLREQSYTLAEFLEKKVQDYEPPPLARKAIVHGHCHHKAIMKMQADMRLLRKMKLDARFPDSGCCGMAGSFGFEAEKYELSAKCGERVLLPAVRGGAADTLIIADGFSCREQIRQLAKREPLHLAQVIQTALHSGGKSCSSRKLKPFVKAEESVPPGVKLKDTAQPHSAATGASD